MVGILQLQKIPDSSLECLVKHRVVRFVIPRKIQMITAKITAVRSSRNGGIPFAFAKAPELQSDDNPDGFVTFTIVPEIWRGRDLPRIGETVALGQLKKKVKPEWSAPRWRAFQARPVHGTPTPCVPMSVRAPARPGAKLGWFNRLIAFLRVNQRTNQRATAG